MSKTKEKRVTSSNNEAATGLEALTRMSLRLGNMGGDKQQDRMIHEKNWSLQHAIKYSYEGAKIRKVGSSEIAPALINPDKTKENYDDKILSTGYEFEFQPGDIFEWLNTGTKWLVTLQELTELAYFKSAIRRCNYSISWLDKETGEIMSIDAAIRGPVETAINYIQKEGISVDQPNHSLSIWMPKNKDTLSYFQRYAKFYVQGIAEGDKNTCWRVEATDTISMPGVLQIIADEYYGNEQLDSDGVVDKLKVRPLKAEEDTGLIQGPGIIKPRVVVEYTWKGRQAANWEIDKKLPVQIKITGRVLQLVWTSTYRGSITLKCNGTTKEITVDSLF